MKTSILWIVTLFAGIASQGCIAADNKTEERAVRNENEKHLTISFDFQRGGIASSQYAIWIEDEKGQLVRTLYATSFTAKGGYKYRKDALPLWVGKARLEQMTDTQVDAVTGATPRNGQLTYVWDGKDNDGVQVPAGKYTFFIEGTLYWKSRVLFSGTVDWGNNRPTDIPVETRYFNPSSTNKEMIGSVKVVCE